MQTNVIYKYRTPGTSPSNDTTITTKALDLTPNEVLIATHPVGELVTLQGDDPEEYGEDPKEYVVLNRIPLLTQIGESGYVLSMLLVVVTDPGA